MTKPILYVQAFALLCFATVSSSALAAGRQAREREARKACLNGDYNKGVAILSDLFLDTKDPTHIFNQGRCFEQNHRYEDALARFDEYLHLPDANLSAEDRAAAEARIANCREKLPPAHGPSPTTAPQAFVQPPPPAVVTPEPAPEPAPAAPVVLHQTKSNDGAGLRVSGIVVASVGVAALVAGLLINLKANSMVDDWQKTVSYTESQSNTQKTYKTLSYVGYGVGGACLATGAILFGIGLSRHADTTEVAFLPSVGPDSAGVVLAGGF